MIQILVVAVALVLTLTTSAAADLFFDFSWQSSLDYHTAIAVNRVNPDGSVTPYDQVSFSGQTSGAGILTLGPSVSGPTTGGFAFAFDGTGGSGHGVASPDGRIAADGTSMIFPVPEIPPVPVPLEVLTSSLPFNGGQLSLDGDPGNPSGLHISFTDGSSPHCFLQGCWRTEFLGVGTRSVQAAEPLTTAVVIVGLAAVVALRRRERPHEC